jgi:hypothetical protein
MVNNGRVVFDGPTSDLGGNEVDMEKQFRKLTQSAA